jgi:predicted transcriptional regulator
MNRTLAEVAYTDKEKQLAAFAKAMGHPVRIQILKLLNDQACCYTGDLTDNLPLAQSTISQHLKVLKEAGLIQGEILPPKVKYCLNQDNWPVAQQLFSELFGLDLTKVSGKRSCSTDGRR